MKAWQWSILAAACLAAAGCRVNPIVASLERENRELENRVYQLAGLLDDCRRQNQRLQARDPREATSPGAAQDDGPALPIPGPSRPRATRDGPAPLAPGDLVPPTVEIPGLDDLEEGATDPFRDMPSLPEPSDFPPRPDEPPPPWTPPPAEPGRDMSMRPRADSAEVESITLNDHLTGGYDGDGRAGHEGVIAIVEPRDAQGRMLHAVAPISVVVLDPLKPGESAHIARWDFTAEEVAARYRRTALSEGIHLEMVWPASLPVHRELHLFVRYTTADGRKLQAEKRIEVDVPALEARLPVVPTGAQDPRSSDTANGWQRTPAPRRLPAATEPVRAVPKPVEVPEEPIRPLPVWSPNR